MDQLWRHILGSFLDAGVDQFFGLPADEPDLLDAAVADSRSTATVMRDQRLAALASTGYGQVSGRPAVLTLSPGPSFTNALTGLLEASSLGTPLIVVTTGTDPSGDQQGGFQVTPQERLSRPLVSWYHQLTDVDQLSWAVRRAVHLSLTSRPGITVIEVAHNLRSEDQHLAATPRPLPRVAPTLSVPDAPSLRAAADVISQARKPMILSGAGARHAAVEIQECARLWGAPVLTTAAGRGVVPEDASVALGCAGLYASSQVSAVVAECDLLIAVGTALEETVRMGWDGFDQLKLVHIDRDPSSFGMVLEPTAALAGDAALTLQLLSEQHPSAARAPWYEEVAAEPTQSLVAQTLTQVWAQLGPDATLVQENGLHDMWSYDRSAITVGPDATLVMPGEQTTMGFGLPAATGAAVAAGERELLLVCGDSAFEISFMALPSLLEVHPRPTMVVLDNQGWGWPRACRESSAPITRPSRVQIDSLVDEFGVRVVHVYDSQDLREIKADLDGEAGRGPLLIRVHVADDDVSPGVQRELQW